MKLPFTLRKPPAASPIRQSDMDAETSSSSNGAVAPKAPRKGKKGKKKRIIAGVLVVAIVGGVAAYVKLNQKDDTTASYTEETVKARDIQEVLSATGTLEPLNQYDVTASVKGNVLQCNFNEGDTVTKGELLYVVDSSDVESDIAKSKLSVAQSQLSYEQQLESLADLKVTSKKAGVITAVEVEKGDEVASGDTIATIRDSSTMKIELPFNSADAKKFYIGEKATVSLDSTYETLTGTVTEIDGADSVLTGNQLVRYVTVSVKNPGALSTSSSGAATIGGVASNSGADFEYNQETDITAEAAGEVTWVAKKGATVSSGTVIAKLASTSVQDSVKNAALSLQSSQMSLAETEDSLTDYQITAPIDGTIVTKNTKVGDTLDNTNGDTTLAVIYDMSKLTFDIALDELDVNKVSVGQKVNITVDALDGKEFTGAITKISVAGTTENGATTYPVTVQIDNPPSELYPGMNVDASIIVNEADNAIAVPIAAVQRGNQVYVKDTTDGSGSTSSSTETAGSNETADASAAEDTNATATDGTNAASSGEAPSGAPTGTPPSGDATAGDSTNSTGAAKANGNSVPEGYHAVTVTTGISDDNYIEIKSGISEGDIIYVPQVQKSSSSSTNQNSMMMGGGGGDMGGGPSGGGGGMP